MHSEPSLILDIKLANSVSLADEDLEKMIDKESQHADEIHRILFDKIDEIKNILLRKG